MPEPLSTEQADDSGGPTSFTPGDLHHLWINGELKTDSFHHFIAALVVMFGKQDEYTLRWVRMALVAATADADEHVWGLTRQHRQQISAFGYGLHRYQITDPGQMVDAVTEMVTRNAMIDTSVCEVLTQFNQRQQEVTA
ncbi:hypothetical protein MBH78_18910 [Oceanimonas sp. NS1]|nr:hypothetical protein [Oceanimonas sp. NS1]